MHAGIFYSPQEKNISFFLKHISLRWHYPNQVVGRSTISFLSADLPSAPRFHILFESIIKQDRMDCKKNILRKLETTNTPVYNIEKERVRGNLRSIIKLPIGIEDFKEIRTEGFYYVDKTGMITELLHSWSKVNLFTRPRRFGKSLNMSMLKYFFSYGCDKKLFEGLSVTEERELCETYMGKFPVLSLTLKSVESQDFAGAMTQLCNVIGNEALKFRFLLESRELTEEDKKQYAQMIKIGEPGQQMFVMTKDILENSLQTLSSLLYKHYSQKVILLIDEYDVPLAKANQNGYYDEMVSLIRGLLGNVLKTNENLFFAVLTGCLRITRESIFTGLNNFKVISITNRQFGEHFGFSDEEVKAMLDYYGLADKHPLVKEWYDGYHFGSADVYCPWDVINYVADLRYDPDTRPQSFWINSSGNDILRTLVQKATSQTMGDLELLVNGMSVIKEIREELTYRELYDSIDNLWSVLFTTGYLTKRRETDANTYELVIPNQEIREIFKKQILSWFQEEARKDSTTLDAFCDTFRQGDPEAIQKQFNTYLRKTIGIHDTAVRKEKKENFHSVKAPTKGFKRQNPSVRFYHGILLGLLSRQEEWRIRSSAESGEGYSDILIEITDDDSDIRTGIVIELKYAENGNLETKCLEALRQIEDKNYAGQLTDDGMDKVLKYGIAVRKKNCMVRMAPI